MPTFDAHAGPAPGTASDRGIVFGRGGPPRRGVLRSAGFSLIEMLTVVSIMGVLAALVFPGMSTARQRASSLRCAQNLRQIGMGMRLYADSDAAGLLPGSAAPGRPPIGLNPWPTWIYTLTNQIGGIEKLRICPSDTLRALLRTNFGCSYVLNEYTAADALRSPSPVTGPDGSTVLTVSPIRRLDSIQNPSGTILVFEASRLSQQIGDLQTHPDAWFFGWNYVLADIDPYRHGKGANYLFADNHVAQIPASDLKKRIESGDNFAVPPP